MAGAGDRILYSCVGNGGSDRSSDGCWADNSDSGSEAVDPGNSAVLSYDAVSHRGQHELVCCGRACGEFCSIADAIYMALQAKGRDSQVGTAVVQSIYLWCLLLYVDVRECLLCQPLCDNLQGCGVCGGSRTCGKLSEF